MDSLAVQGLDPDSRSAEPIAQLCRFFLLPNRGRPINPIPVTLEKRDVASGKLAFIRTPEERGPVTLP